MAIKMKINQKLIMGFLIIALLIGVVGYVSINLSEKALQESIGENSALLARETIDKIDRDIYNRIENFQQYSVDLILQEEVIKSNQEFEQLDNVQAYIDEKDKEWISAPKGTTTLFMQELMNNELSQELTEKIEFYEEKYGYKVIPEAYVTNKYGIIIATTGRTSDYLQADEEWYQTAIKEKEFWVGEIEYDESSDSYAMDIVINLYDENENFAGILKAVLNIETAINILRELECNKEEEDERHIGYETREFKLINKDAKIIYSTEEFEFFEIVSDEFMHAVNLQEEHIGYFIAQGDKAEEEEEEELFAHVHSKGYKDYKGLGWILIVEHETEEIFTPINELKTLLLGISIIIAILAILFGIILSKSITKPIQKLTKCARRIKKGNLTTKCEVKSGDELEELGQAFDSMRLGLKDRSDLLNALLTSFKGKFGNIASILVRKNIKELAKKNPRVLKIIPKNIANAIKKEQELKKSKKK